MTGLASASEFVDEMRIWYDGKHGRERVRETDNHHAPHRKAGSDCHAGYNPFLQWESRGAAAGAENWVLCVVCKLGLARRVNGGWNVVMVVGRGFGLGLLIIVLVGEIFKRGRLRVDC